MKRLIMKKLIIIFFIFLLLENNILCDMLQVEKKPVHNINYDMIQKIDRLAPESSSNDKQDSYKNKLLEEFLLYDIIIEDIEQTKLKDDNHIFTLKWDMYSNNAYYPLLDIDEYRWNKNFTKIQYTREFEKGKTFGIEFYDGKTYQENLEFNDIDFSFKQKGFNIISEWELNKNFSAQYCIGKAFLENDKKNSFYKLDKEDAIFTGSFSLEYLNKLMMFSFNYIRDFGSETILDYENYNAYLQIYNKEWAGLSSIFLVSKYVKLYANYFFEKNYFIDNDRNRFNCQLELKNSWLNNLTFSPGFEHLDNPDQTNYFLLTGFRYNNNNKLYLNIQNKIQYYDIDYTLLNKSDIFISWKIFNYLNLFCNMFYAFETNNDQDTFYGINTGISYYFNK